MLAEFLSLGLAQGRQDGVQLGRAALASRPVSSMKVARRPAPGFTGTGK